MAGARLGLLYLHGHGVAQNFAVALTYFKAAASGNDAVGILHLGILHYHGWGVTSDIEAATKHFKKAAAFGQYICTADLPLVLCTFVWYCPPRPAPPRPAPLHEFFCLCVQRSC